MYVTLNLSWSCSFLSSSLNYFQSFYLMLASTYHLSLNYHLKCIELIVSMQVGLILDKSTCGACLETLKLARVLSCGHHVCLRCTQNNSTTQTQHNNTSSNNINTNHHNTLEPMLRCSQCLTLTKVQDLREEVTQINHGITPSSILPLPNHT